MMLLHISCGVIYISSDNIYEVCTSHLVTFMKDFQVLQHNMFP